MPFLSDWTSIEPTQLYYPMLALVLLTFMVGGWLSVVRWRAVRRGEVRLSHFRSFTAGTQPETLAVAQRAYGNLFEAPPLFYIHSTLLIAMHQGDGLYLSLAWLYVAARAVQALIHLTYNDVRQRGAVHGLSCAILVFVWLRLGGELLG